MLVQPREDEIDAMNSDRDSPRSEPGRLQGERTRVDPSETVRSDAPVTTTYTPSYDFDPRAESFTFEHDKENRVFRLADAEGKAECFHDKPARYVVVVPDPDIGEMRLAGKHG
jgi:hypothetical protein